ncbi:hypothetical protein EVAR_66247_1 [Eumeta japonica]|uniref:Uncharacterized protein n=1 Tax=Eumeta variegata TaxID=151549 RepID=A0A4C1ZZJ1_EUMVA|nr:hypothetical protein EVAR_66247_1 [Eumeta japonica]
MQDDILVDPANFQTSLSHDAGRSRRRCPRADSGAKVRRPRRRKPYAPELGPHDPLTARSMTLSYNYGTVSSSRQITRRRRDEPAVVKIQIRDVASDGKRKLWTDIRRYRSKCRGRAEAAARRGNQFAGERAPRRRG